jgi:uncharacterized membrane protein
MNYTYIFFHLGHIAWAGFFKDSLYNGCFFKFGVEVGVEVSIVNALYRLRISDQLFKSYAFTRVVRSRSFNARWGFAT